LIQSAHFPRRQNSFISFIYFSRICRIWGAHWSVQTERGPFQFLRGGRINNWRGELNSKLHFSPKFHRQPLKLDQLCAIIAIILSPIIYYLEIFFPFWRFWPLRGEIFVNIKFYFPGPLLLIQFQLIARTKTLNSNFSLKFLFLDLLWGTCNGISSFPLEFSRPF